MRLPAAPGPGGAELARRERDRLLGLERGAESDARARQRGSGDGSGGVTLPSGEESLPVSLTPGSSGGRRADRPQRRGGARRGGEGGARTPDPLPPVAVPVVNTPAPTATPEPEDDNGRDPDRGDRWRDPPWWSVRGDDDNGQDEGGDDAGDDDPAPFGAEDDTALELQPEAGDERRGDPHDDDDPHGHPDAAGAVEAELDGAADVQLDAVE